MTVIIFMPILTRGETNVRQHWGAKARRHKAQREAARLFMRDAQVRGLILVFSIKPTLITLTRQAMNKRPMDCDNLPASMKHVRDGIADAFGVDDGRGGGLNWSYAEHRTNKREQMGVVVTLEYT